MYFFVLTEEWRSTDGCRDNARPYLITFVSLSGNHEHHGSIALTENGFREYRAENVCAMRMTNFLHSAVACHNCAVLSGQSQI